MISVIIPLYNKEPIIERTLRSVLSQDYDDIEVVIVNDGSTDRSSDIVRQIDDSRIRLIEQENGGPSKARNTGIMNAKGDWILFLDADDELYEGALVHLSQILTEHNGVDIVVGGATFSYGGSKHRTFSYSDGYCENIFKSIATNKLKPYTGSILYSSELCKNNTFDINLRRYEDYECFFRKARTARLYTTSKTILSVNADYCEASKARNNIKEDFLGHLDFKNKSFWERICLYKLYIEERNHYLHDVHKLYPTLRYRYDLFFVYKVLNYL